MEAELPPNFSETFSASETATTNGVEVGSTFSLTGTLQIGAKKAFSRRRLGRR